jgi:hypothetical protein
MTESNELKTEEPRSIFEQWLQQDVYSWLKDLWARRGWKIRLGDGKLIYPEWMYCHDPVSTWLYTNPQVDCYFQQTVLFDTVRKAIGKNFVPSYCHQCWKVVVRPRTLVELFAVREVQEELGLPAKCGLDIFREYVPATYGAYWYNRSRQQAHETAALVRLTMDRHEDLGPDVPCKVKRACTEFERVCGDSNKWKPPTVRQLEMEALIGRTIVYDYRIMPHPKALVRHVFIQWVKWAFQSGDETYKRYTDGKPVYAQPVVYDPQPDQPTQPEDGAAPVSSDAKEWELEDPFPLPDDQPPSEKEN